MSFYPIEIDTCPAYGWEAGPNVDIDIKTLRNKHERRNWVDANELMSFSLNFRNIPSVRYLREVLSFFRVMHGPHRSFLAKDYGDFRHGFEANDDPMPFATGDGETAEFQLTKTYVAGEDVLGDDAPTYVRDITKPVAGTVTIYVNGVAVDADVDSLTGMVSFSTADTPAEGDIVAWTGEFRVCVRFATFYLPSTFDSRRLDDEDYVVNGSCSLVEVPGE